MNTEELAPLVVPPGDADLDFRAGTVLAWNPTTGQNTIDVGGAPLQDLPMLSIGDTVNIAVGDTVALLRYKSTMYIQGRIVQPGSGVLATSAILPATATASAGGYSITTELTKVSVELTAPDWSNAVTVFATLHATGRNDRGVTDYMYCRVRINGSGGAQQFGQADASPNPSYATVSTSYSASGLLPGGTSFLIEGTVNSNTGATWSAHGLNQCDLTYSVIYFRV